jgi:serine/threonine protein kinase
MSEIHRGGQGVVYKAIQKATKRTVALKVLLEGPYASPRQRHRFEREIDLVARRFASSAYSGIARATARVNRRPSTRSIC